MLAVPLTLAEPRIALIIGNSNYANARLVLPNPVNDAKAMQRALESAGFETILKLDAKRVDFYRIVEQFGARLSRDRDRDPQTVGLFYFAGHGVQADGVNYLIPVDAEIGSDADLQANAFDAGRVLHVMQLAQNEVNIVILDACRDNPLPRTRSMLRGLARMEAPSGTFIAYAAGPGQAAQDGATGTNGVFTGELVKAISKPPGVPLEQMFKTVIKGVKALTHGTQQPWSEASIQGDFCFQPCATPPDPRGGGDDAKLAEMRDWDQIKNSHVPADFEAFLAKYPNGEYEAVARNHLDALRRPRVSGLPPGQRRPPQDPALAKSNSRQEPPPGQSPLGPETPRPQKTDRQCASLAEREQLGESLSEAEYDYLKNRCH